jgi:branched-chain amino acid transport system permease protein
VFSFELLLNAVAAGLLLGGFYAAVSLGISLSFGILEVANIAHPVFIIAGAYATYALHTAFGLDPILAGLLLTPLFYGLGVVIYRIY